jgi:hypothetical protein
MANFVVGNPEGDGTLFEGDQRNGAGTYTIQVAREHGGEYSISGEFVPELPTSVQHVNVSNLILRLSGGQKIKLDEVTVLSRGEIDFAVNDPVSQTVCIDLAEK